MNPNYSEISPAEWISLNQFLHEIRQVESPCISVYYPYGKGKETIAMMRETRRGEKMERVEAEIEKRIAKLKVDPPSVGKFARTLCVFGWLDGGKVKIKVVGTSRNLPYIYMATKRPYLKPFRDILKINYTILLVILDQKAASIRRFVGNMVVAEDKLRIDLQGKHKKGGQSQKRFLNARQEKINAFFKDVRGRIKAMDKKSDLILLGGSGEAKKEFYNGLDSRLAEKCRVMEGVSPSTPERTIHQRMIRRLYQHRRKTVIDMMEKYEGLVKSGLAARKNSVIYEALKRGAVSVLIVSADYHADAQFRRIVGIMEAAKKTSARIEFVTNPVLIKKLESFDSVLAILRYRIK